MQYQQQLSKRLRVLIPVTQEFWDARTREDEVALEREVRMSMDRVAAAVTGPLTRSVAHEAEIEGLRLAEDEAGNPVPPMVILRYEAMAIPRTRVIDPQTAPQCVHCGHPYGDHKRNSAPVDIAVYVPCTACDCTGYLDSDPFADTPPW